MSNETIRTMLFDAANDPASIKVIEHIEYDNFVLNKDTYTGYDSNKPQELYVLEFVIEEDNHYLVNENYSELIYSFLDWVKGDDCLLVYNDEDDSRGDSILYRASTVLPKGFSSNKLVRSVSLKRYIKKGSVVEDDAAHKEATAMASKSIIAGIHEAIDNQDMLLENTSVVNPLVDPISDASAQCVRICVYVHDNFQPVLTIEEYKALAALYSPNNKLLTSIQNA
jgi:hypothetical protein